MVRTLRAELGTSQGMATRVAQQLDYGVESVRTWVRQAAIEDGEKPGVTMARLMRALGIQGIRRGKQVRITRPDGQAARHPDLVDRTFVADRPNALWVTDLTYVPTWAGAAYVCFIVERSPARSLAGERRQHAPQNGRRRPRFARWSRGTTLEGLVCHSDAGSQFTSVRYGERLAELGAVLSIGSVTATTMLWRRQRTASTSPS